jgi:hypothetical protein
MQETQLMHKIPHFVHSTEKSRDDMFFLFL